MHGEHTQCTSRGLRSPCMVNTHSVPPGVSGVHAWWTHTVYLQGSQESMHGEHTQCTSRGLRSPCMVNTHSVPPGVSGVHAWWTHTVYLQGSQESMHGEHTQCTSRGLRSPCMVNTHSVPPGVSGVHAWWTHTVYLQGSQESMHGEHTQCTSRGLRSPCMVNTHSVPPGVSGVRAWWTHTVYLQGSQESMHGEHTQCTSRGLRSPCMVNTHSVPPGVSGVHAWWTHTVYLQGSQESMHGEQWCIQDFPGGVGGGGGEREDAIPKVRAPTYYLTICLLKTAWKWNKWPMEGGVVAFLASPLCDAKYSHIKNKVTNKLLRKKRWKTKRKRTWTKCRVTYRTWRGFKDMNFATFNLFSSCLCCFHVCGVFVSELKMNQTKIRGDCSKRFTMFYTVHNMSGGIRVSAQCRADLTIFYTVCLGTGQCTIDHPMSVGRS